MAAGASCAAVGSLGRHDESPGEVFTGVEATKPIAAWAGRGDGARFADRYFQQDISQTHKLVPEGIEGQIPFKGPVEQVVHQLVGGLRAAMGYTGSAGIADQQCAKFVRMTLPRWPKAMFAPT